MGPALPTLPSRSPAGLSQGGGSAWHSLSACGERAAPQHYSILGKPRLDTPTAKHPPESDLQGLLDTQHQEQVFKEPACPLTLPKRLNP